MSRRVTSSVVDVIDSEANLRIIDPSGWLHFFFRRGPCHIMETCHVAQVYTTAAGPPRICYARCGGLVDSEFLAVAASELYSIGLIAHCRSSAYINGSTSGLQQASTPRALES